MKKQELEQKIESLRTLVQESQMSTSNYTGKLADVEKELKDLNKPVLTASQLDNIHEAVEYAVDAYDFSDTDNYEKDFELDYDGRVQLSNFDLINHQDLVEMIVDRVSKLFVEAEELDTTEADNHA